jgi:hypothetical protein
MPDFEKQAVMNAGYDPKTYPIIEHMNYDTFDLFEEAIEQIRKNLETSRKNRLSWLVMFLDESSKIKGYEQHLEELDAIFADERKKVQKAREIEAEYADKNKVLLNDIQARGYSGDPFGFAEDLRRAQG